MVKYILLVCLPVFSIAGGSVSVNPTQMLVTWKERFSWLRDNLKTIQGRLWSLFLAFFLLVLISGGVTFWGLESQKQDATIINLAGRQRMLLQLMTRLALESSSEDSDGGDPNSEDARRQALQEAVDTFDLTLSALQYGGEAPYLPGEAVMLPRATNSQIFAHLALLQETWESFRGAMALIEEPSRDAVLTSEALRTIETLSPQLVEQADQVVRLFEAQARNKVIWLRWVQITFLGVALALLTGGAWSMRRSVIASLQALNRAAERIGQGDLSSPVILHGPREVKHLADTLEEARVQLLASRQELLEWANTLEDRVARRTRELEALYQVSREIASRLDIQHVLRSVTEKAGQLIEADVAFLCLVDEDGKALTLQANSGATDAVHAAKTKVNAPLPALVLASDQALPCGVEGCHGACGIIAPPYRVSHLAAPLRLGERVIGALCVGSSRENAFSTEEQFVLTRLANSAAIALENARLYARAEQLATMEERQRIAAEMHDGLAQTLNYLRLTCHLAQMKIEEGEIGHGREVLGKVQQALDRAEGETRRAIASLEENLPLRFTLQEQLESLVEEFNQKYHGVRWQTNLTAPLLIPPQDAEQVLRVVREALQNACHHSGASVITLLLDQIDGHAQVQVLDDGRGFDPENIPEDDQRGHFGLKIMRARAARLGGKLEVRSTTGQGTQVRLTWPLLKQGVEP